MAATAPTSVAPLTRAKILSVILGGYHDDIFLALGAATLGPLAPSRAAEIACHEGWRDTLVWLEGLDRWCPLGTLAASVIGRAL